MKKICVISDATSPDFWFPLWYQYYSKQFGSSALHLVTYEGLSHRFRKYELGGLTELPCAYNDVLRSRVISAAVNTLLYTHDIVIRCDVDEFLIANPKKFLSLNAYLQQINKKYVTAVGFDVVESPLETEINFDLPILGKQRRVAMIHPALHKTSLVTVPAYWGPGFHGSSLYPSFDELFLAHFKFANVSERVRWHSHMLDTSLKGGSETEYFSNGELRLKGYRDGVLKRDRMEGWDALSSSDATSSFLKTVHHWGEREGHDFYQGSFSIGEKSFEIPSEFSEML